MFRGYRFIFIALVGLALGSQAPSAQGVPSPSPAPKELGKKTGEDGPSNLKPLPVVVVQSATDEKNRERSEAESRQHDARDLDAQIRAADAAEKQIFPSWFGAALGSIGTCLLIWTLLESQRATRAARGAAESAEKTLHATRAWVMAYPITDGPFAGTITMRNGVDTRTVTDGYIFIPGWQNWGQSPAIDVRAYAERHVIGIDADIPTFVPEWTDNLHSVPIAPGDHFSAASQGLDDKETAAFRARLVKVVLYSAVRYHDIFTEDDRHSEVCYVMIHNGWKMSPTGDRRENIDTIPIGPQNRVT